MQSERLNGHTGPINFLDIDVDDCPPATAHEQNMVRLNRAPNVVVIIPAFNEERFIGSVVLKARRHAQTVVVVDDGSHDATADIAETAGALVVRHTINQGKGVALNTGFQKARELMPDVVVTLDADGQHVPGEIHAVMQPVVDGQADLVVGSRYLDHVSDVPVHRVLGHRVFNFISNGVSGIPVSDSQSGFRAFSPLALQVLSFKSSSFSVESEMQLLAREHKLRVSEVPITIHYLDKPKRSVVMQGMTVLNGVLRLTGQYRPLLFFGVPGLVMLIIGIMLGTIVFDTFGSDSSITASQMVLSTLVLTMATLSLFTGIILHSVRGLLLGLDRQK